MRNTSKGFTLVEMLVVMAIIAIIAGFLFPTVQKVKENARTARARAMMETLGLALQAYRVDWGVFGPNENDLNDSGALYTMLTTSKKNGPYMEFKESDIDDDGSKKKLLDPWAGFYIVVVDTDGGSNSVPAHNRHSFDISCTSKTGTEINNWE
ncbi:MAG: prepilin-type N-terminal cleavage/methylation domain-containing protein [Candidatus Auribacterota bacterium]|jgi:prepilin-type N-terminal cleavage/methylation domain-containing protein|uniref:Prepilin-type N-terminal cleavage/methylation domain-containing protein n=1 Tax=Candidatus Auribacter fodinae TaxID=2093366 RepID=A0A3A4QZV0_9BACT|nr:MAG: prepilin-type N-terminal cleavage/methylation domain-containing protein [Candidatus Auribacter fodinae]